VEIAYFTFPDHEGLGIATAMARELIRIARAALPDVVVTAQTLPEENASTHILRKLGFAQAGIAHDDDAGEVWEWHLHPGFRLR
jgi:RimJ/RimL family protein N-acetyltransferase